MRHGSRDGSWPARVRVQPERGDDIAEQRLRRPGSMQWRIVDEQLPAARRQLCAGSGGRETPPARARRCSSSSASGAVGIGHLSTSKTSGSGAEKPAAELQVGYGGSCAGGRRRDLPDAGRRASATARGWGTRRHWRHRRAVVCSPARRRARAAPHQLRHRRVFRRRRVRRPCRRGQPAPGHRLVEGLFELRQLAAASDEGASCCAPGRRRCACARAARQLQLMCAGAPAR